jgi:hypothetical protein
MVSCKPISFTKNIALKKRESLDAASNDGSNVQSVFNMLWVLREDAE